MVDEKPVVCNLPLFNMGEFDTKNDEWPLYQDRLEEYLAALKITDNDGKRSTLIRVMGSVTYKILRDLCLPKSTRDFSYDELCKFLKDHLVPISIVYRERKKFYEAHKSETESVSDWVIRVKSLAANCEFGTATIDTVVRDKFVCGLGGRLFEKLCEEDETLTLKSAVQKACR